jgi:hypothetical protein
MNHPVTAPELPSPFDPRTGAVARYANALRDEIGKWFELASPRLRIDAPKLPTIDRDFQPDDERRWMAELVRRIHLWLGDVTLLLNSQVQSVGDPIASAATIEITNPMHHITGAATITQINVPTQQVGMAAIGSTTRDRSVSGFTGPLWLFSDGGFSLATGGNIAKAKSSAAGDCVHIVYDGDLWFPVS